MEVTITISVSKARLERGMEEKHLMMSDKLSLYKEIVNEMETSDKKVIVNFFMYMLYHFLLYDMIICYIWYHIEIYGIILIYTYSDILPIYGIRLFILL